MLFLIIVTLPFAAAAASAARMTLPPLDAGRARDLVGRFRRPARFSSPAT